MPFTSIVVQKDLKVFLEKENVTEPFPYFLILPIHSGFQIVVLQCLHVAVKTELAEANISKHDCSVTFIATPFLFLSYKLTNSLLLSLENIATGCPKKR